MWMRLLEFTSRYLVRVHGKSLMHGTNLDGNWFTVLLAIRETTLSIKGYEDWCILIHIAIIAILLVPYYKTKKLLWALSVSTYSGMMPGWFCFVEDAKIVRVCSQRHAGTPMPPTNDLSPSFWIFGSRKQVNNHCRSRRNRFIEEFWRAPLIWTCLRQRIGRARSFKNHEKGDAPDQVRDPLSSR